MAGQPDINAILAALAAQNRVAGTPSQQPPQLAGLPAGFPGHIPQQSATPSMPTYGLPQPSSSGSLDLSAVRPTSTGTVSIADAIAKARSIAADKNPGGPPRDDPRLAGRPYGRRSRSRSRSPGRRGNDSFRDNYNPYRDERRGEERRGGGGYGRDRSPSPQRRGGQESFSPRDKDSETIIVKSALVGLIIGRAGENLRRVEAETGARVQFVPAREPGAPQRQCTISGSLRQREAAKREIFQTIEDNGGGGGAAFDTRGGGGGGGASAGGRIGGGQGRGGSTSTPTGKDGELNRQILVPDKTVGLIIGRKGETIRDLQDRSGCHVNIVGENKSINGRRPVNLIGTKEAADRAEAIIWEIVDSDTNASSGGGGGGGDAGGRARNDDPYMQQQQQPQDRYDDGKINESIHVPSVSVGMIIGKGGESIKDMQNATGCKINVHTPGNPDFERQIDLVGSRNAIEAAKRVIWEKVDTAQSRDRQKNGGGGGRDRDDSYSQQPAPQPSYAQPPAAQGYSAMPGMPQAAAAAPPADPNAPDPYAQYGGYNNYIAMWWAAMQQQQGQQQPGQ